MSGSPWAPWATVAGAVIAALAALLVAGVLSARGRLQRRLEKQVAIYDKLPAGPLRQELERLIKVDTAELLFRSYLRVKVYSAVVLVVLLAGVTAAGFALWPPHPASPGVEGPSSLGVNLGLAGIALWAATQWGIGRQAKVLAERLEPAEQEQVAVSADSEEEPLESSPAPPATGADPPPQSGERAASPARPPADELDTHRV